MNVQLLVNAAVLIVAFASACGPTDGGGCFDKYTDFDTSSEIEVACDPPDFGAQSYRCTCVSLDAAQAESEFLSSDFCTSTRSFDSVKEICGF